MDFGLGGLFGGGASGAADAARRAERNRQRLVNQGTDYVNAVFGGGAIPTYTQVQQGATYDPNATYYTNPQAGAFKQWTDRSKGHFSGRLKKNRPLYMKGPDQTFTGFQPSFFNDVTQNYINYALPQLASQYKQAYDTSTYDLAGRGLLRSSAADEARSNLDLTMGKQKLAIADTGAQMSQDIKKQVENARQSALDSLYQTADPLNAVKNVISQSSQIQVPSLIQPLGNAFSNIMNQYALQQLYPLAGQQGTTPVNYGYGGYNPYYGLPNMGGSQPAAYY